LVTSNIQAARLTAAQTGVWGQSFEAVVDELRNAYVLWQASVRANKLPTEISIGDTGRMLKVRMVQPWPDGIPLKGIRGVKFGADGSALVPDDVWWRQMINDGCFCLCGVESGKSFG
jgi:hypothetical protein